MARVHAECCVLLADGSPCRREACFTCDNWHLVCMSHRQASDDVRFVEAGCPVCTKPIVHFSTVEDGLNQLGRRSGDFPHNFRNFIRAAAARWFPEFTEPIETNEHGKAGGE